MIGHKALRNLQQEWYRKLKEEGFIDIENISHESRPLKEWHNNKFSSKRFQIIQSNRSPYQKQIDEFANHPTFMDACKFLKRYRCKFTVDQIALIWELHRQGLTRREIAERLGRVKSRIDDIIRGLTEWMQLI